jgi:hypothetical protein
MGAGVSLMFVSNGKGSALGITKPGAVGNGGGLLRIGINLRGICGTGGIAAICGGGDGEKMRAPNNRSGRHAEIDV